MPILKRPSGPHPEWPVGQIKLLQELWTDGRSASQIAKAMNAKLGLTLSRNAVLGKVHRLKLPARPQDAQKRDRPKKVKLTPPGKAVTLPPLPINRPNIVADAKPILGWAFLPLPGAPAPKPLHALSDRIGKADHVGECRWPIGENPTLFCGCPANDRYCPAHAKMAYRPIEKKAKAKK